MEEKKSEGGKKVPILRTTITTEEIIIKITKLARAKNRNSLIARLLIERHYDSIKNKKRIEPLPYEKYTPKLYTMRDIVNNLRIFNINEKNFTSILNSRNGELTDLLLNIYNIPLLEYFKGVMFVDELLNKIYEFHNDHMYPTAASRAYYETIILLLEDLLNPQNMIQVKEDILTRLYPGIGLQPPYIYDTLEHKKLGDNFLSSKETREKLLTKYDVEYLFLLNHEQRKNIIISNLKKN